MYDVIQIIESFRPYFASDSEVQNLTSDMYIRFARDYSKPLMCHYIHIIHIICSMQAED